MFNRGHASTEELHCSFCHKSQDHVQKLISNPPADPIRAYICDECVAVCASILGGNRGVEHPALGQAIPMNPTRPDERDEQ